MEAYYLKIIESIVIIGVYILVRMTSNKFITKTTKNKLIQKSRAKIIRKAINIALVFICILLILTIWGVNQSDLAAYIGSILTVVGVAFFAQWSLLSNITSSIILFFNHSVRIDDSIIIMEGKEYEIEGRVSDIGLFFVTVKTKEGEEINMPNNLFLQKMIKKQKP
ncbi:mechanosensitive ion channel family protein [Kordia sp.]|uniref:mechanosensitive ion channel family protein n=1 Tax=Kordia sp. TaxID=1965332 RepID=UPI003D2E937B